MTRVRLLGLVWLLGLLAVTNGCSSCENRQGMDPQAKDESVEDVVSPGLKKLWKNDWTLAWKKYGETLNTKQPMTELLAESLAWRDLVVKLPPKEQAWPRLNAMRSFLAAMHAAEGENEASVLNRYLEAMSHLAMEVQTNPAPLCAQFLARNWENEILLTAQKLGLKPQTKVDVQVNGTLKWWTNIAHLKHEFTPACHRALARADAVPKEMETDFYFYALEWLITQLDRTGRTEDALAAIQQAAGDWKDDPRWVLHQDNLMPLMQDMDKRLTEQRKAAQP